MCSELNVRVLETCSDQLKYATLRAEPDWQALGKRLGKALASECGEALEGVNSVGFAAGWRPSLTGRRWARGWARRWQVGVGKRGKMWERRGGCHILDVRIFARLGCIETHLAGSG